MSDAEQTVRRYYAAPLYRRSASDSSDFLMLSLLLLVVGVSAWLWSLPQIDPSQLGGLGLITILPMGMCLAYAAILGGFCLSLLPGTLRTPLPFLFLVVLVLLLHATPAISYGTLRYSWAWKHVGVVDYIMRNHHLDQTARYLSAYFNWPGFFLAAAWVADRLKLDPLGIASLARFFPTALNLLMLVVLPVLYRSFTSDWRLIWTAAALFIVGNWVGQDYFSPQGSAYLLYLMLFALLAGPLLQERGSPLPAWASAGLTLVAFAIIAAIVSIHQITPLFVLSALFLLVIVGRISPSFFFFALGAELLWLFYIASPFVAPELSGLTAAFGRLSGDTLGRLAKTDVISPDQRIVSLASRGLSGLIALLGLVGLVARYLAGHRDLVAFLLMIAPMPVLVATPYGGEIIFRMYLFAIPLFAFFGAALFVPRNGGMGWGRLSALVVVLAVLAPAFVLANNGKDAQYRFSPLEVEASNFLYTNSKPGQLLIEGARSYPSQFRNYENFAYVPLSEEIEDVSDELQHDPVQLVIRWLGNAPVGGYVIITRSQKALFDGMGLLPPGTMAEVERRLIASPYLTVVYRNPEATILTLTADIDRTEFDADSQ